MAKGYIIARAYTSRGIIPIANANVSVTSVADGGRVLLGFRVTDENGLTTPIELETPDVDLSLEPNQEQGFAAYNIRIEHPDFYTYFVRDAQVFPNTTTVQNAELVPIEAQTSPQDAVEEFQVTPQNL